MTCGVEDAEAEEEDAQEQEEERQRDGFPRGFAVVFIQGRSTERLKYVALSPNPSRGRWLAESEGSSTFRGV